MQYALAASSLLFATLTLSQTIHEVTVGPGLTYNPNSLSDVAEGDWISVTFGAGHDIVQSTFAEPCQAMEGGIYSGPSPEQGDVFSWQVNSTDPSWFYCSVGRHCQGGMALAINPTSQNTIEAYQSAAEDTTSSSPSGSEAVGGTFAAIDAGSSSDSSSASESGSSATGSASSSATAATGSASEAATSATGSASGAEASATGDSGAAGLKPMGAVVGAVAVVAAWAL